MYSNHLDDKSTENFHIAWTRFNWQANLSPNNPLLFTLVHRPARTLRPSCGSRAKPPTCRTNRCDAGTARSRLKIINIILLFFNRHNLYQQIASIDLVTDTDKECEELIFSYVVERYSAFVDLFVQHQRSSSH